MSGDDETKMIHEKFVEFKKQFFMFSCQAELEMAKAYDQAVLTLSGSALGFSMAFIKDIAPKPQCKVMLLISWLMFAVSILSILASMVISQAELQKQRRDMDIHSTAAESSRNSRSGLTKLLNWTALISTFVGIIFLAVFALLNMVNQGG